MGQGISQSTRSVLWGKSGRRCALPDCRRDLIPEAAGDEARAIGEIAHIGSNKPGAARYDAGMSDDERNSYENLIVLCPTCHRKIDAHALEYTAEHLVRIKKEHEDWVRDALSDGVASVTFAELDVVCKYIMSDKAPHDESLVLVPLTSKIRKNELSEESARLVTMGLSQVKTAARFVDESPDIGFGDRLRDGFVSEYERLTRSGAFGDELFSRLREFAGGGSSDFGRQAAGLVVLVYMFEKCEVFER